MKVREITGFTAFGFRVRTSDIEELDPNSAQIAGLWEAFFFRVAPLFSEESSIYGVYSTCGPKTDSYDVCACADKLTRHDISGLEKVEIPSGRYLVFSAQGKKLNQTVSDIWQQVERYFNSEDCSYERLYSVDFEHYIDEKGIEVFVSIK